MDLLQLPKGLKDRLGHPIIAGFIISWIVFNWRFLLFMIFAKCSIEEKFIFADQNYLNYYKGFFYPITTSLVLMAILPWITAQFERLASSSKTKMKLLLVQREIALAEKTNELANLQNSLEKVEDLKYTLSETKKNLEKERQELDNRDYQIDKGLILLRQLQTIGRSSRKYIENDDLQNERMSYITKYFEEVVIFLQKHLAAEQHEREREPLEEFIRQHADFVEQMKNFKLVNDGDEVSWKWRINEQLWVILLDYIGTLAKQRFEDFERSGYSSGRYAASSRRTL